MKVYIFSRHTNNFKILWKSSDTIESVLFFFLVCSSEYYPASEYNSAYAVLFFFNFSVIQVTGQPYSIYLNGTNFRGFFFLEKNCISRVFIFAVCPFKDFFAGINFRGLLILCTFLNIAQISRIKEKKERKSF